MVRSQAKIQKGKARSQQSQQNCLPLILHHDQLRKMHEYYCNTTIQTTNPWCTYAWKISFFVTSRSTCEFRGGRFIMSLSAFSQASEMAGTMSVPRSTNRIKIVDIAWVGKGIGIGIGIGIGTGIASVY